MTKTTARKSESGGVRASDSASDSAWVSLSAIKSEGRSSRVPTTGYL